jgi:hypothetical protein
MNIFLTSKNPRIAAKHLDDLRLNKMILETAQLLSAAYRNFFGENKIIYKTTHFNHPCTIWARKNLQNMKWLNQYFYEIAQEKFFRTGKMHKSFTLIFPVLDAALEKIPEAKNIKFDFNCTPYKKTSNLCQAYQKYLMEKWKNDKRTPQWTKRKRPYFYK